MKNSYKIPSRVFELYSKVVIRSFFLFAIAQLISLFFEGWFVNKFGGFGNFFSTGVLLILYVFFVFPVAWKGYKIYRDDLKKWRDDQT
jgi:hypothetical protein